MRAFGLKTHAEPAKWGEVIKPVPESGQVRVRIVACGLNFADLLLERGTYQDMPALPFSLGLEAAGIIDALGAKVTGLAPGMRVAVFGGHGGLAEFGVFDADRVLPIPDTLEFETAAGFQIAYGTSHVALDHCARLRAGETLLVLGAAGGVGLTAVEIGKLMGARVIACARGADKLAAAQRAGADILIDADDGDLRQTLLDLGGADVVYDPVGGDQFTDAFRACRPGGRILNIGFASGDVPLIKANHLLVKNISVIGFYWGGYLKFAPEVINNSLQTLLAWQAEGRLHPHVSHILPREQAREGLTLLKERKSTGKVVIRIADG